MKYNYILRVLTNLDYEIYFWNVVNIDYSRVLLFIINVYLLDCLNKLHQFHNNIKYKLVNLLSTFDFDVFKN